MKISKTLPIHEYNWLDNTDLIPFKPTEILNEHNRQDDHRVLQLFLTEYTSPPLPDALELTPEPYRGDSIIDASREAYAQDLCSTDNPCHIVFLPDAEKWMQPTSSVDSSLGIILYGNAFVDPRSYSVLASRMADRYGITTVIPIFDSDLAGTRCDPMQEQVLTAQAAVDEAIERITTANDNHDVSVADSSNTPVVPKKWIFAGHGWGGLIAQNDAWTLLQGNNSEVVAGFGLLAADVRSSNGPGMCTDLPIDLSQLFDVPVSQVLTSEDLILDMTRAQENEVYLNDDATFHYMIDGGNHGGFGSYDYSERENILGQMDGTAKIAPEVHWDITVAALYDIATRTGLPLPTLIKPTPQMETTLIKPTPLDDSNDDRVEGDDGANTDNNEESSGTSKKIFIVAFILFTSLTTALIG